MISKLKSKKNLIRIICTIFIIILSICTYKEVRYPSWGQGKKVLFTNASVTNTFHDDAENITYSLVKYKAHNGESYEKWFQINLPKNSEQTIYYIVGKEYALSRLSSPLNQQKIIFLLFGGMQNYLSGKEILSHSLY